MGIPTPTISRNLALLKTERRCAHRAQRYVPDWTDTQAANTNSDPFPPDASPVEAQARRAR